MRSRSSGGETQAHNGGVVACPAAAGRPRVNDVRQAGRTHRKFSPHPRSLLITDAVQRVPEIVKQTQSVSETGIRLRGRGVNVQGVDS